MKEIAKQYDPSQVEARLYKQWQEKGYFHTEPDKNKKPFTIVMPPPNITGQLHMGHALDNMTQDTITRFKRMQGFCTLWLPGTDHARIATELKIVETLEKEGTSKSELGREAFLERAWEWKAKYGGRIVEQLKKLGSSCDWQRERFTMDEGCSKAVVEVFVNLYNKGLIYRGDRIINWCPECLTAISDAEVEYEEKDSHLWFIKYSTLDGKDGIIVATTRPETMLGDTAVAVNPNDERYKHLIGSKLILPIVGREIPVVADEYVEMEFGTGAVKITPAHDPNDFEVASRHNLPIIRVMNDNGTMNQLAGKYNGIDRFAAREAIVKELKELDVLVKIDAYKHNVGQCYRCRTVVEPIISKQWFVQMKPLAEPAIEAVKDNSVTFVPDRFSKTYFNWMENIRDWCISRQLWWGHRIPAYYCNACGETIVAKEMPDKCPKCGGETFSQDEDVLDTWFSSALWPFSTLGWPDKTEDLKYFYPTSVLVTAYDIIFFWVARMIFSGIEHMGEPPFSHVLIHGIVRDAQGRKMSKSLGNGIDPLEIIENYGADALRFSLAIGNSPGNDMRFNLEKVEAYRNFANKIWNASRFVMMNLTEEKLPSIYDCNLDIADKWILSKYNSLIVDVTKNLEKYELGLAAQKLYDFIWNEYCDWYIELTKPRLYSDNLEAKQTAMSVLCYALSNTLKLLHPFMPFITEEIWQSLPDNGETIMLSDWPLWQEELNFVKEQAQFESIVEIIRNIRNLRAEMNVPINKHTAILISTQSLTDIISKAKIYIEKLAYASSVELISQKPENAADYAVVVCEAAECYIPLGELIDVAKELERLNKDKQNLTDEISRAQGKLNNKSFMDKAPSQVVQEEQNKLAKYKDMLIKVEERLDMMGAMNK